MAKLHKITRSLSETKKERVCTCKKVKRKTGPSTDT